MISKSEYHDALVKRHGYDNQLRFDKAVIGIAGLGGIGSNVAALLTRMGIGSLVLVDFDKVDLSNIHRQFYNLDQIGLLKTEALVRQLTKINPYCRYIVYNAVVTSTNICDFFGQCSIIIEALDDASTKANFTQNCLTSFPKVPLIGNIGMAGFESSNEIITQKRFSNYYICGDQKNGLENNNSLSATRVAVCAAHAANIAIRLILGKEK